MLVHDKNPLLYTLKMNHLAVIKKIIIIYVCVLCTLNLTTASPVNSNSDFNSQSLSSHDVQQCDNLWWSNFENWKNWKTSECSNSDQKIKNNNEWQMKNQTWENLTKQCRNDNSLRNSKNNCHRSKKFSPFEEKMWSKWQKFSDCRCQSLQWDPKNQLGITVCYQVAWYNPHSGKFVGEITTYRWKAKDQMKNISKFGLQFKFPYGGGKVSRHLKVNGNGWFKAPSARYSWNDQEKHTLKIYINGYLSKNHNDKSLGYLISPSEYKLVYDGCDGSMLQENQDYQNIWSSSYIPVKPYAPALESGNDKCLPPNAGPPMPNATTDSNSTMSTDMPTGAMATDMPTGAMATDMPTGAMATDTPTETTTTDMSAGAMATDMPTGTTATDTPTDTTTGDSGNSATPASSGSDQSSETTTNETTNSGNTADPSSSSNDQTSPGGSPDSAVAAYSSSQMSKRVQLPGTTFGTFPFGLILFSVLTLIGIGCVARTTWERKRYRNQFRRRQEIERQALGRL